MLSCAYYLIVSPSSSGHRLQQSSVSFHCAMVNGLLVTEFFFCFVEFLWYYFKIYFLLLKYSLFQPSWSPVSCVLLVYFSLGPVKVRVGELSSFYIDSNWLRESYQSQGCCLLCLLILSARVLLQLQLLLHLGSPNTLHCNPIQGKRLES